MKSRNKLDHERVIDRLGFVFKQYREEYLFYDVIEVLRKLYLVTVVMFPQILHEFKDCLLRLLDWLVVIVVWVDRLRFLQPAPWCN